MDFFMNNNNNNKKTQMSVQSREIKENTVRSISENKRAVGRNAILHEEKLAKQCIQKNIFIK